MRETSPAVLMAEATIPVTTPIKEENGIVDLRVVYVKVKGEQEMVNAVMDTGAQMPVVRPDVVEGQSIDNRGSIQIKSAFGEHEMGEKTLAKMIRNPAKLRKPSKEEGIISSTDSKSVCSQEVITNLRPETYTQSLLNVPNGDLVAVKINASNVQTNGQDNRGECTTADEGGAKIFPEELAKIIEDGDYSADQVFNADETGLYWKKLPNRTYIAKDEKTASGHKCKDRVTLLLCSNASGDRMLKPLLINKSLRPRALKGKDLKQLPVHWMANPKAWMTTAIFTEWFNNCFVPSGSLYEGKISGF
ncbi:tigger transposable element-derived protein 1 [Trichonephila clavipes]|nr:tigger transposable element-derived protein 1 [Trichonephila clavipes]